MGRDLPRRHGRLPAISRELGGGITTQQWVVDAYLITLSALILLAGSVSDAYGRVLVMRIGLIAFGVASVAVAAAPDPLALITAVMRGEVQSARSACGRRSRPPSSSPARCSAGSSSTTCPDGTCSSSTCSRSP